MEIDTDFDSKLEKYFEEYFNYSLRNLRGTEVEITTVRAAMHNWYFTGANEMKRVFMRMEQEQHTRLMNELDSARIQA